MSLAFADQTMTTNSQMKDNQGAFMTFSDIRERRLAKHEPGALALRAASAQVIDEIISLANLQVERWEKNSLCSKD